jgi:hypothetical protein
MLEFDLGCTAKDAKYCHGWMNGYIKDGKGKFARRVFGYKPIVKVGDSIKIFMGARHRRAVIGKITKAEVIKFKLKPEDEPFLLEMGYDLNTEIYTIVVEFDVITVEGKKFVKIEDDNSYKTLPF